MLREQLAVTSCVFKETEIPILWAEAKRVKRRKDTPNYSERFKQHFKINNRMMTQGSG